ncbi:deoxyribonuclease-2-beta [Carcharodon carcharias]|uniref:deoxyribonuclease-2-beta n=1 Tax=Carcharodon carcharias TaxID=13397 RepID=UPI001B7E830E|nr:deoxyribonuclease-2-beta [Carcharodon carcharias]
MRVVSSSAAGENTLGELVCNRAAHDMEAPSILAPFFLLIAHISSSVAEISCRDEAGQPVDWFAIYKLPKHQVHQTVGMGLTYMYLDPSTVDWQQSKYLVNMTESALGRTLHQLYSTYKSKVKERAYFIYNDAAPLMPYDVKHGHTKGVLLFDKAQGFWLSHSTPNFPPFPEKGYSWPSSGRKFGQTLFCFTYNYSQMMEIGRQLLYYNPHVYNWSLPQIFLPELSDLRFVAHGISVSKSPWIRHTKLTSTGGVRFQSFAKYKHFDDDIYAGWVAQALKTDLLAKTWNSSKYELPSNCSLPYHVYNVARVKLPAPALFDSHNDHSKWCASLHYYEQWICIGDLNRTFGQMQRSGGLLCTRHPNIYKAFRRSVSWYKNCTDTQ